MLDNGNKDKNIVFGVNPVLESFRAPTDDILEVLISDAADRQVLRVIKMEALRLGLRVVLVAPKFLDQLVGSRRHQGVVVRVKPFKYFLLNDLLSDGSLGSPAQRVLLLDGLTDPRNFGARKMGNYMPATGWGSICTWWRSSPSGCASSKTWH